MATNVVLDRRHSCVDARAGVPPATDSVQGSFMPRYF
jgi:hypothetical protein